MLRDINLEILGISSTQWTQYSTDVPANNLFLYYGYPSGTTDLAILSDLETVSTFLQQTGLSQQQLHELVYEDLSEQEILAGIQQGFFYINLDNSQNPIVLNGQLINNLTVQNLNRIMRFVRLAQTIGWSFTDLDWALQTIRPLINSRDQALPYLAWIQEQVNKNGLTINQCCGILGQIKSFGEKDGPSFYATIFENSANPQLPPPPDGSSWLTWTVPPITGASSHSNDKQIESALAAAFQINQSDLLAIAQLIVLNVNSGSSELKLTPVNLVLLYRMSLLPKLIGKPIESICIACDCIGPVNTIGLVKNIQLNNPITKGMFLNLIIPGGTILASGQINNISSSIDENVVTFVIVVASSEWVTIELSLDLPNHNFVSVSVGGVIQNSITSQNADQCIYLCALESLLSSNQNPYDQVLYAIHQLNQFFSWLSSSPLTLGELQFITLGKSDNLAIQNKILGADSIVNFINDLTAAISKVALPESIFIAAVETKVAEFFATFIQSTSFNSLINPIGNPVITTAITALLSDSYSCCKQLSTVIYGLLISNTIIDTTKGVLLSDVFDINQLATYVNDAIATVLNDKLTPLDPLTSEDVENICNNAESLIFNAAVNLTYTKLNTSLNNVLVNSYNAQQKTFAHQFSAVYHTTTAIAKVLINWGELNLNKLLNPVSTPPVGSSSTTNLLSSLLSPGQNPIPQAVFINLQQAAELISSLSLSPAEAAYFKYDYHPTAVYPIAYNDVRTITDFKRLVKVFNDSQNNVLNIIQSQPVDWSTALASLSGWKTNQIEFLTAYLNISNCDIAAILQIESYFTTAGLLGINISNLIDLVNIPNKPETSISSSANSLWSGLQSQLKDSPTVLTKIQNKLNEKLRNKLVSLACFNLSSGPSNLLDSYGVNARGLYAYLLIDVEVSGVVQTTPIREAISAVQLYVYRCLNQLEPDVTCTANLPSLWQWMQSYRMWQANMEVFLYPEDYIQPELRVDKTDLFTKAESDLKQVDLTNPDQVEVLFKDYMNGLEKIGNIQVISSAARTYEAEDPSGLQNFKELCMIGAGAAEHGQYYYRLAKFRDSVTKGEYIPYEWGQWKKVNIAISAVEYQPGLYGTPKPIYAFGRWYLFWIEQKKNNSASNLKISDLSKIKYDYYSAELQLSYLDFNKNWVNPQNVLQVNIVDTTIVPVTVNDSQSATTTISYLISTKHDAEIHWLSLFEENGELPFKIFEADYTYQPFKIPNVIDGNGNNLALIKCLKFLNTATNAGAISGLYAGNGSTGWGLVEASLTVLCFGPNITNCCFAGTDVGLYGYNYNGGVGWTPVAGIPTTVSVQCICNDYTTNLTPPNCCSGGTNWLVGTSRGLYTSTNNGAWQFVNEMPNDTNVLCVLYDGTSNWYAGTAKGLYTSSSLSSGWTLVTGVPQKESIICLQYMNSVANAGTANGAYVGNGSSGWVPVLPKLNVLCFGPGNSTSYLGATTGLYQNTSGSWSQVQGIPYTASVQCICNDYVVQPVCHWGRKYPQHTIVCTPTGGANWLVGTSSGLYGNMGGGGWALIPGIPTTVNVMCVSYDGRSNWYAGTSAGLFTTTSASFPNNWILVSVPYSPITPAISPTNVYTNVINTILIQGEPNWFIVNGQKDQYLNVSYPTGNLPTSFNIYRLNSTAIPALGALLNAPNGVNSLLTITAQETPESLFENLGPVNTYIPTANYPIDVIDFSNKNAMRMYYWELFFHLPFLVANELNTQQHFAHAKCWLEYVFNPLISNSSDLTLNKYWRFLGLRTDGSYPNQTLVNELAEGEIAELRRDLNNAVQLYASDSKPFDPQAIAQLRPIAYQKTIVMHYINNLLAWGDMLYRENTRDSINEAEMLYVLAYNLLGEQPNDLGTEKLMPANSYPNLFDFTCIVDQLIGTRSGLYYWNTMLNAWILVPSSNLQNIEITCLAYDGTSTYYAGTKGGGLLSSTDQRNWQNVNGILSTATITCLYFGVNGSFAGTGKGMYYLNDESWTLSPNGSGSIQTDNVTCICANVNLVFAGTANNVYRVAGDTWWSYYDPFPVTCISFFSENLYFGTQSNGLYQLKDNGVEPSPNWSLTTACISYLYQDLNQNYYVGTKNSGLYYMNAPSSWVEVSSTSNGMNTLTITCILRQSNGLLYAGTNEGLFYMNDTTKVWQRVEQQNLNNAAIQVLYQDSSNNLWIASSQGLWELTTANTGSNHFNLISFSNNYFGIPQNQQFMSYWDQVKQRIFNIRNGLTLTGQADNLPLFSPPINPMDLVEAVGSGESIADLVQAANATIPYYRFEVMIQKAKEYTLSVVQLGQSLLSALQTKDGQKLAELYNQQQQHILSLTQAAKQDNLSIVQQTILSLNEALTSAQYRQTYYSLMIAGNLSATEQKQIGLANDAITAQDVVEGIRVAAIAGYCIPTIFGFSDGGFHPGDAISQGATIAEGVGSIFNQQSGLAGINAGYQRRLQDWQLQAQLATDDINQINYQIVGAQYEEDLAQQEITILQKNIAHQKKIAEFYLNKFTNDQLYSWYAGQLSGLYYQTYQLAHDVALQAENTWKYEHIGIAGNNSGDFIKPGYWNSLYEGLLSGESLQFDLQRMEKSYMDQNVRRFEINKTISLAILDPKALMDLINTGTCQFDITEQDFAWDFPGHYCRKIKSVSISIPMILGPYQNIHATFTQLTNKLISADGPTNGIPAVEYLLGSTSGKVTTALKVNLIPNQQVALSQGTSDTGMFQLNFNDPRYLPFEGTGAVSSWQLDLPINENSINFESITDVIVQLNYTALPASSSYKNAVTNARLTFNGYHTVSLAQEFPSAWYGFVNGASPLQFKINSQNWRGVKGRVNVVLNVTTITLYVVGVLRAPSLTLNDGTTSQSVTLTQSSTNSQIYSWKGSENGGFPLAEQSMILEGLPAGIESLPGLTNIIMIATYSVS